jgi:hypothetical protein
MVLSQDNEDNLRKSTYVYTIRFTFISIYNPPYIHTICLTLKQPLLSRVRIINQPVSIQKPPALPYMAIDTPTRYIIYYLAIPMYCMRKNWTQIHLRRLHYIESDLSTNH